MTEVINERVDDMARGRPVRIDGKARTIPHAQVARYEAIEAQIAALYPGDEREHERNGALRAAALYLLDPPEPVSIPLPRKNGSLSEADEARHEAILEAIAPIGAELQEARTAAEAATAAARVVTMLTEADGASELGLQRTFGVDRGTVRRWRGKQDR